MRMRLISLTTIGALLAIGGEAETKRLQEATDTIHEMLKADDKGIPQELLDNSMCAIIVPGMKKAAFLIGGKFGRGFMSCRNDNGIGWKAPAAVRVEGGSVGFQIGGSETDVIMLVKSRKGAEKLMESKFTLGGDVSVAGGPVGRTSTAQTDLQMRAEILSWSRARGVFAGAALDGATLREDKETNKELYGKEMTSKEVLSSSMATPAVAKPFVAALTKHSGRAGKH